MSFRTASLLLAPLALMSVFACSAEVDVPGHSPSAECMSFQDRQAIDERYVIISIQNESGQDMYLPATCGVADVGVAPASGETGRQFGRPPAACSQTCGDLISEDPELCDAAACAPSSIRVAPGERYVVEWVGVELVTDDMPEVCWLSEDVDSTSCSRLVYAEDGDYEISMRAFASCGEDCSCDEYGLCTGAAIGAEAFLEPITVTMPGDEKQFVDLTVEGCAFGCPG